jgi:hypothetical protein
LKNGQNEFYSETAMPIEQNANSNGKAEYAKVLVPKKKFLPNHSGFIVSPDGIFIGGS